MNSSYKLCILLFDIWFFSGNVLSAQNVGIGLDTPLQQLDVDGGIRLGNTTEAHAGSIRWNEMKSDFEGYNGVAWVSLTGGMSKWGNQSSYSTENYGTQVELQTSTVESKEFGFSIAAEGNWMVAGAYRDGVPNDQSKWAVGSVYLFQKNNGLWQEKYLHRDPELKTSDWFGRSVAITPTHIISGTPNADIGATNDIGKAYIYTYDLNNSALQSTLIASDGQGGDNFGNAVAIHGDIAVVGAPGNDVGGINNMGSAYVFIRNGNTWTQTTIITPSDGQLDGYFGSFVALWGDYLAISTPYKMVNNIPYAGKTYVYKKSGTSWVLISNLVSPNPSTFELFGHHVYIRDHFLLVGAPDHLLTSEIGSGSLYVYALNNFVVTHHSTLTGSEAFIGDGFGYSAVFKDGYLLVGAPYATIGASINQGKAYLFKYINNAWVEEVLFKSAVDEQGMRFGNSVALGETTAMVSAPWAAVREIKDNGKVLFINQH